MIPPQQSKPQSREGSGWIEDYFVTRCRKKYGPYYRYCWQVGNKIRHRYLPRKVQSEVQSLIDRGCTRSEILNFLPRPRRKG
jgi:hypothetical protein